MLTAVVLLPLIIFLFLVYGWAFIQLIRRSFHITLSSNVRFSLYFLAGMSVLIWISQLLSLMMPISLLAFSIILIGGMVISLFFFRSEAIGKIPLKSYNIFGYVLLGLVLLSILENSSHLPTNPDTGIYHAQAIRWIETYQAVPGLGNLHSRFAYNSSWLVLNALFSLSFLGLRSFHLVPAALVIIATVDFTNGAVEWLQGKNTPSNILRSIFLPLTFYVLGSQISSPGTDLPVILTIWLLLTSWMDFSSNQNYDNQLSSIIIFFTSISLLTMKLSAAPILLLAGWIWLKRPQFPKDFIKITILGLVTLLPWFGRNVILSGYLIYPLPTIDWFSVDWKIPIDKAKDEIQIIKAWGRDPGENVGVVLSKPFISWFRLWFIEKTANQKIILLTAGSSIIYFGAGLLVIWKYKLQKWLNIQTIIVCYATAVFGGIYWLFTSPDIRFGYGFLLAMICIGLLPWIVFFSVQFTRWGKLFRAGFFVALIIYQAFFYIRSIDIKTIDSRLIYPLDYPELPSEPCPIDGNTIWCAGAEAWTQCWYDPFPCIPQPNDWIEFRGTDLKDGFRPKR